MTDPSKPTPPLATGGMSRGEGTTTIVKINRPDLDPIDKKVLCAAMCQCDKAPNVGKDGKQLKQACVAKTLKEVDKHLDYESPYKQEINYDMTKSPPAPIMDKDNPTKGHDWLPGWIGKYFGKDEETGEQIIKHTPNTGQIRRPDVVIVKDPTKPPTQDNIKQIVEMKFPPDSLSEEQAAAYKKIAGDPSKLQTLKPDDCDCNSPEPEPPKMPVQEIGTAATILMWLAFIISRGRTPRPQPI
ncbi:MAG: VRR-NUC domain-containing protein [Ideonella sp.]|nr:VRR-NUC domain-containing protein [Ideonella sp.]